MNCSTSLSVSIIYSSQNPSKPHIKRDSFLHKFILGNNKNITFYSCHQKDTSTDVCTMKFSVKGMVSSPKPPSSLEKTRASLAASDSARATNSHCGSGGVGVSPSRNLVPERSRGLFSQDGSLPFDSSVSSPNPPSCSDSDHASLTTSDSASTSRRDIFGGGVSPSGKLFPERSGGLFSLIGLLTSEWSKKLGSFQNTLSGNVIFPVVGGRVILWVLPLKI